MHKTPRDIHGAAEHAREAGNFVEALNLLDEATVLYAQEKDYLGMSEAQGSRFLTLRHLYEKTGDIQFLILGRYAAESGFAIAQKADIKEALALPLFNLAKADETIGNYKDAYGEYLQALDAFAGAPPPLHNRPGVLFDIQIHAFTCAYFAGEKDKLSEAVEALSQLEKSDEPQYNKDVWVSGGYMRLAQALKTDEPEQAKEYLQKAKVVIDSNPDLTLRLGQWERLAATF